MVLTVSFVISPVIGLFCHRRQQVTTCQLDASVEASGPHDFAVRVSTFRQACFSVHRIPYPTSVTIAKRPVEWGGLAGVLDLIWAHRVAESPVLDSMCVDLPLRERPRLMPRGRCVLATR